MVSGGGGRGPAEWWHQQVRDSLEPLFRERRFVGCGNGTCNAPCVSAYTVYSLLLHVAQSLEKRTMYSKTHQAEGQKTPKQNMFFEVYSTETQVAAAFSRRLQAKLCQALHFLQRPAKASYACDNASCCASLHSMLYKKAKRCKYQCLRHGRQRHGSL